MKEKSDFVFVGENLALDLINTEIVERSKPIDLLAQPEDAEVWWEEAQEYHGFLDTLIFKNVDFDEVMLVGLKDFRLTLRSFFEEIIDTGQAQESMLHRLNEILRLGQLTLKYNADNQRFTASHYLKSGITESMLFPMALAAVNLLTQEDLTRLHKCHNELCVLLFYDTTKSATRKWCSSACHERERSRKRYQKAKQKR